MLLAVHFKLNVQVQNIWLAPHCFPCDCRADLIIAGCCNCVFFLSLRMQKANPADHLKIKGRPVTHA